ncbi:MAG TPA: VIT1/CCC1 transporter family protein [Nocardioidaceae bacterium]|nr:VIT1/CCC1 transporter family protein [Nocardioidaceae bacterium]
MSHSAPIFDHVPDAVLPVDHEHPDVNSGWLRASVFGAMDGLVSNFALIAGMVGGTTAAGADAHVVVLAGVAGLAAGAFSMAVGEYNSVASQAEYALAQVAKERAEIIRNPRGETAELVAMYVDKGVEPDTAEVIAQQIHRDVDRAVTVHAMEEFGVDPADVPSPKVAAGSSFLSFAVGAAIPLVPFLVGLPSLWLSLVSTLTALFLCGAVVARVTTRSWWWSGLRPMLLGGAAAAVTYLFGSLVGAGLG